MGKQGETVVVVGAGLGGLSAAVSLQAEGYQVTVVEKNQHFGGKLNEMTDQGFNFDLGPSILTMPYIFEQLFARAGKNFYDYVAIEQLPLEWRSFFQDGTTIDLYSDLQDMQDKNSSLTEQDVQEFEKLLKYGERMYELTDHGYFRRGLDTFREVTKYYGWLKSLRGFDVFSTMDDVISRHISNTYLKDTLNFFIKYVGSSPYRAPAVMTLLPYIQNEFGLWYVRDGLYRLAEGIYRVAREIGVEFEFSQKVVSAKTEGDRIISVLTESGSLYSADYFLSNMEVLPFYKDVTEEPVKKLNKYSSFEPSCSGYVMHLGVRGEYPQLAHHNFFFSEHPKKHFETIFEDYELPEDPTIYLVAAGKTDSGVAPQGHENLKILPHIPHIQDREFTEEQYQRFEKNIITKLEKMGLKDLEQKTVYKHVWRPKDIHEHYLSNRGSIYGVVADKEKNKGFKFPKQSDIYRNLLFAGGSVNPGGGMPMVSLSGQLAADKLLEKNV